MTGSTSARLTVPVAETGAGGVTSHMIDGECRQLHCLNGGICIVDSRQHETCQYVLRCTYIHTYIFICSKNEVEAKNIYKLSTTNEQDNKAALIAAPEKDI